MNFVNLLKRLAGLDPTAVTMTDDDPFELSPPRSPAAFLRSLPLLGPQPLYLCLEGITDDSLLPLLQQCSVPPQLNVARGNPGVAVMEAGMVTRPAGVVPSGNPGVGQRPSERAGRIGWAASSST